MIAEHANEHVADRHAGDGGGRPRQDPDAVVVLFVLGLPSPDGAFADGGVHRPGERDEATRARRFDVRDPHVSKVDGPPGLPDRNDGGDGRAAAKISDRDIREPAGGEEGDGGDRAGCRTSRSGRSRRV